MDELEQTRTELALVAQAKNRYESTNAHQGALTTLYDTYMRYYDPPNGDQWPNDRLDPERADKIHMSVNFVKPVVDIESRLQAIIPRIALDAKRPDDENDRKLNEAVEKLHLSWLQDSNWDVWMADTARTRAIFGKTVWKPFWNNDLKHPDVMCLERIESLRIGWAGNDYRKKDWALFEYRLSPFEAMDRWDIKVLPSQKNDPLAVIRNSDHTDPLDTIPNGGFVNRPSPGISNWRREDVQPAEYEQKQVTVWDYWYKKRDNNKVVICNATIIEGVVVEQNEHREYMDIPYIVIENDHRPGSPEGISTVKAIMDLQDQYNLALSLWAQTVYDNVDLAYQLSGETADHVEAGMVPKRGQIIPTGVNNEVLPVPTSQNQFPVQQLTVEYWAAMFRVSGLPEILFGGVPGAQISGRALATQIEAVANRLDPKRRRLYAGLIELFRFWKFMVKAKRGTIEVMDEETEEPIQIRLSQALEAAGRWKIVAPELTPRDVVEVTQNAINQVQAKFMNLTGAMDMVGVDAPEEMLRAIIRERNNVDLYPGDVQIKAAVMATLQQMQMQQQAMAAQTDAAEGDTEGAVAGMQGAASENTLRQMGEQPAGDAEAGGVMSTAGEPGGAGLGGTAQTLIRPDTETGQAEALQQIGLRRDI